MLPSASLTVLSSILLICSSRYFFLKSKLIKSGVNFLSKPFGTFNPASLISDTSFIIFLLETSSNPVSLLISSIISLNAFSATGPVLLPGVISYLFTIL